MMDIEKARRILGQLRGSLPYQTLLEVMRFQLDEIEKMQKVSPDPKPSTEWDGEGYPPVGCECEAVCMARGKERDWFKTKIKYLSDVTAVMEDPSDGEFVAHPVNMMFRPLRTKEQKDTMELGHALIDDLDAIGLNVSGDTAMALAISIKNRG